MLRLKSKLIILKWSTQDLRHIIQLETKPVPFRRSNIKESFKRCWNPARQKVGMQTITPMWLKHSLLYKIATINLRKNCHSRIHRINHTKK
jgi:hypothetical protein